MIKKVHHNPDIYRFSFSLFGSEVYLLQLNGKNIIIDTGSLINRSELKNFLEELKLKPEDVNFVLLTHDHFDHSGNIGLFENAKIYGNKHDFKKEKILPTEHIAKLVPEIEVISTPGHTKGSVCYYLPKYKILFSGDTIFDKEMHKLGRLDLPGSAPDKMDDSLNNLKKLKVDLLCPGHLY